MALLSIGKTDALQGLVSSIVVRTEEIAAVYVQETGVPGPGSLILVMKSGESVPLVVPTKAAAEGLLETVRSAL
jgi:hypothetical protein